MVTMRRGYFGNLRTSFGEIAGLKTFLVWFGYGASVSHDTGGQMDMSGWRGLPYGVN